MPSESVVRYTYRLRPSAQAERTLAEEWGRARWVWNQCVVAGKAVGKGHEWAAFLADRDLTEARAKIPWLAEGSSVVQQQVMRDYSRRKAKGAGPRRLKKKHARPSLNYTRNGFSLRDGRLRLAGGASIPVVWSRGLPSEPTSVRVYQDSLGHWYASFVVRRSREPLPPVSSAIGIDWGVKVVATTTDPAFDLKHPEHAKKAARALAKYQRRMARRRPKKGQPATPGYLRAKADAARLHKKVARQREHTARKWSQKVVADHGALAVEDFKPKFLAKSTMARKAQDAAIGATKRTLVEYAKQAGRTVVLVEPAYTTQTCNACGARAKRRVELWDRVFACHACGLVEDRDRNAARVILARAGLNPAAADAVRHFAPPGRVLAEAGIPALKGGEDVNSQRSLISYCRQGP